MNPTCAAALSFVFGLCAFLTTLRGQEGGSAASQRRMVAAAIPADVAIVFVQAPKGTRVYSDTHHQDYGEQTRFEFGGLKPGKTYLTEFTVTFPSRKKVSRLFYLAGGQQFTLVFRETQEARPTLALQRAHALNSLGMGTLEPSLHARFSDDNQYLITWSKDRLDTRLWDTNNGRLLRIFQTPDESSSLFPRTIIRCGIDATKQEIIAEAMSWGIERFRWNMRTGMPHARNKDSVFAPEQGSFIDYSASSNQALLDCDDGVWIYDVEKRRRHTRLGGHGFGQSYFFAGANSSYACKLDFDAGTLTIRASRNGAQLHRLAIPQVEKKFAPGGINRGTNWNIDNTGQFLFLGRRMLPQSAWRHKDSCLVVDIDAGETSSISDTQLQELVRLVRPNGIATDESSFWVAAQMSQSTKSIAVGNCIFSWPNLDFSVRLEPPWSYVPMAFSSNGERVVYCRDASNDAGPQFMICEASTGRCQCVTVGGTDGVSSLLLSEKTGDLWVGDESKAVLHRFDLESASPKAPVIFRPVRFRERMLVDGANPLSVPALVNDQQLVWFDEIFNRNTGQCQFSFKQRLERMPDRPPASVDSRRGISLDVFFDNSYDSIASHDGTLLAFESTQRGLPGGQNGYKGITLWDIGTRSLARELIQSGRPLAWRPDQKAIVYADRDSLSGIVNLSNESMSRKRDDDLLMQFFGPRLQACFSPDGTRLAVSGTALRRKDGRFFKNEEELFAELFPLGLSQARMAVKDMSRSRVEIWDGEMRVRLRTIETVRPVFSVAFSPDSRLLAYSAGNEIVVVSEQGYVMRTFSTHSGNVGHLVWNADSRRLLSASVDGTIGLWDVGTGDELARLVSLNPYLPPTAKELRNNEAPEVPLPAPRTRLHRTGRSGAEQGSRFISALHPPPPTSGADVDALRPPAPGGEAPGVGEGNDEYELSRSLVQDWLVVTPDGLFDGSLDARQRVGFRVGDGLTIVPVDQFFQDFYRPGLWSELWQGERPMPSVNFGGSHPPKVTLVTRIDTQKVETQTVTIVAEVTDQGGGFRTPWLRHNGVVIAATLPYEIRSNGIRQPFAVTLVDGENQLEIVSASKDGSWESEPATISLQFASPTKQPALHVVAVGINQYAGGLKLNYSVQDAQALADLFKRRGPQIFSDVHVRVLSDAEAPRDSILKAITNVKAVPQDVLVLFLSGHGRTIGQRYYFLPFEFRDEPQTEIDEDVRNSGIPNDALIDQVKKVAALKRLIIYDTCQSGGALGLPGKEALSGTAKAMEEIARAGTWLIAAASSTKNAHEHKDLKHGLLTYSLLAGAAAVEHGPLRRDYHTEEPFITVRNWLGFAKGRVPKLGKDHLNIEQSIELHGSIGNFPVLPAVKRSMP